MFRHLLLLGIISLSLSGTTLQRIDQPKTFVQEVTAAQQLYTFMTNQTVQIQFPNLFTAFEGKVYDRQSLYNQSKIHQDFIQNPQLYKQSQNCEFIPAYFDLDTQEEVLEISDYKIISHSVDWDKGCTYILTDTFIVLKTCANGDAQYLFGREQQTQQLGTVQGVAANSLGTVHYNMSDEKLFVFTNTQLFLWINDHFVPIQGYSQKQYSQTFTFKNNQLYILQPYNSLVIYNFTDHTHVKLAYSVNKWKENMLSPVDFKFVNSQLWILDSEFGLYTYSLKWQNPDPKNSYVVRFGKKMFFEVNEDITFMIVFQLNGDTYVAEMVLIQDVLYLNRFYDKINGIREIIFLEQRVAIIGEQEMMTIQHSTNPTLLANNWQDKSFYAMFGLSHIQANPKIRSPQSDVLFTMIKDKKLYSVSFQRYFAVVTCNFDDLFQLQSRTVYLQMNSTLCRQNQRVNMSTSYCNVRFHLNYSIVGVISSLLSLILTILIILIAVMIFVCLLISAKRMKQRKQSEIQELQSQLKKRMEQEKKNKEISQGVLHHQV